MDGTAEHLKHLYRRVLTANGVRSVAQSVSSHSPLFCCSFGSTVNTDNRLSFVYQ